MIKFRIWRDNSTYNSGCNDIVGEVVDGKWIYTVSQYDYQKIELSSGLLDGAGREIYDGDILQDEDGYLWTVSYSKEDAMFQLSDATVAENFGNVSSTWYMIVGNINENGDLLK